MFRARISRVMQRRSMNVRREGQAYWKLELSSLRYNCNPDHSRGLENRIKIFKKSILRTSCDPERRKQK